MNCNEMLELMLEADPDELAGKGTSAVATHVRTCAKCGAVAAKLLADTSALATALDAPSAIARRTPVRRARLPRPVVLAGALAAAMVLVALWPTRHPAPPEATVSVEPPALTPTRTPAQESAQPSAPASATPAVPRRFADAVPVVATPFVATPAPRSAPTATELATLSVDPPPGMRAAVFHTKNPAITVVWLY